MRFPMLGAALLIVSAALAADNRYTLDLGASVQAGNLRVEPSITGPAGKTLEYEMRVRREGGGNSSNSSQGGTVKLDDSGRAQLASNSVSVTTSDRYVVTVRVMDEGKVVAEQSQHYP